MLFNTYLFVFVFLPVAVAGFFLLGRIGRRDVAIVWIIATSLVFYGWNNWPVMGLLLFSLIFNYAVGLLLAADRPGVSRKAILIFGLIVNIGMLAYFKYCNFLIENFNALADRAGLAWLHSDFVNRFGLPLGISFYIFQKIAYIIDCYQRKVARYNFLHYCAFVAFFPQLIAGPIVHHKQIVPQFSSPNLLRPRAENFSVGITIFVIGLAKKVLIADNVATFSTAVFTAAAGGQTPTFAEAWLGALCYAFQIYFDFSGYSDMAIGMARLFGIRLPLNFASPYKSVNIIDFWRRWHMTLSRFLRDYLYIPLGGNRGGLASAAAGGLSKRIFRLTRRLYRSGSRGAAAMNRSSATYGLIAMSLWLRRAAGGWLAGVDRYVNLMITMLLGGLWHGANWSYMLWGGLHGGYLVVNHAWHGLRRVIGRPYVRQKSSIFGKVAGRTITFLAVLVAWTFFKAGEFHDPAKYQVRDTALAATILKSMAGQNGFLEKQWTDKSLLILSPGQASRGLYWVLALLVFVNFFPNTQQYMYRFRPAYRDPSYEWPSGFDRPASKWLAWRPIWIGSLGLAVLTVLCVVYMSRPSEFIYWQF